MNTFHFESSGLQELNMDEQQHISGGFGLTLLAALGGFVGAYNLGKIVGEEAYHLINN